MQIVLFSSYPIHSRLIENELHIVKTRNYAYRKFRYCRYDGESKTDYC